jgi:hypothetical protein
VTKIPRQRKQQFFDRRSGYSRCICDDGALHLGTLDFVNDFPQIEAVNGGGADTDE